MFEITKTWSFDAAHHLPGLPDGHKCARVHGHSWQVSATIASATLRPPGFVTDFGDLKPFGDYLATVLDHRDLNEVLPFAPTSEALAEHLADWYVTNVEPTVGGRLVRMRVSESPSSSADFVREAP